MIVKNKFVHEFFWKVIRILEKYSTLYKQDSLYYDNYDCIDTLGYSLSKSKYTCRYSDETVYIVFLKLPFQLVFEYNSFNESYFIISQKKSKLFKTYFNVQE